MRRKWVPPKPPHLCSEHFFASCFEYRWGMRCLKTDAVPTVFQTDRAPKRANPNQSPSEGAAKKLILECHGEESPPGLPPSDLQEPNTLSVAIDPGVAAPPIYVETNSSDLDFHPLSTPLVGAVNLVPVVQIVEPLKAVTLTMAPPGEPLPDPVEQHVVDLVASLPPPTLEAVPGSSVRIPGQLCTEVAVPCGMIAAAVDPSPPLQALMVGHQSAAEDQGTLIIENVSIEPFLEADPSAAAVLSSLRESSTEMVAYFETIPMAPVTAGTSSAVTPPETVLSSALSLPIVSTVPIVSNQISPEASSAAEIAPEPLSPTESLEEQLDEHPYHKHEVTTAELVGVVMGLQKKVKVLQQRHRRHCAKLEAMEGVVEQLRKENLVSEEKLKLLEMACLQSSTIVPESGGAVAIICQNNDQALVYAVPQLQEDGNETIIHLEEQ